MPLKNEMEILTLSVTGKSIGINIDLEIKKCNLIEGEILHDSEAILILLMVSMRGKVYLMHPLMSAERGLW